MTTCHLDIALLIRDLAHCDRCLDRLEASLTSVRGVLQARVDRGRAQLELIIDPAVVHLEAVEQGARSVGVELGRQFSHVRLTIAGLDCMDCAQKIERGVLRLPGVLWCAVNFATAQMQAEYETGRLGPEQIIARVHELGYDVAQEGASLELQQRRRLRLTVASGLLLAAGTVLPLPPGLATLCLVLSVASGGWLFVRSGVAALRMLEVDTNLLMGAAALGAAALGFWHEAATVVFLYSLGNVLEGHALERNRRALEELIRLAPARATKLEDGQEQLVEPRVLRPGDVLRIRPWERVPVDLEVLRGESHVDQSSLTGESEPVPKHAGDTLLSGSLNGEGLLEGKVVHPLGRDTLSQVIELVREAQSRKAPSQTFMEKFGRVYSPLVLGAAVLLALYGALFAAAKAEWFVRSLTLLVVACPCALVIATPVAIASALACAARMGILVKGGAHLELLGQCRTVALDKTGTLTVGRFSIAELVPLGGSSEQDLLSAAAVVAGGSDHPVARAIARHVQEAALPAWPADKVTDYPGRGLDAEHEGVSYAIGRETFMADRGYPTREHVEDFTRLAERARAVVGVGRDGRLLGLLGLADEPRTHSLAAVERLGRLGIDPIVMLTGDLPATALAVAERVGIKEVRSGLLPGQKSEAVDQLTARHGPVAMVGDGVNDAPAMARAAVGIAMGSAGNAVAMETADIVVMGHDLRALPALIELSRRTSRVIRQNVAISLAAVAGMLACSLGGYLGLAGAVLAHEGSALLVIGNGLRLLDVRDGRAGQQPGPGPKEP